MDTKLKDIGKNDIGKGKRAHATWSAYSIVGHVILQAVGTKEANINYLIER